MEMMEEQSGTGSAPTPEALKVAKTIIDVTPNKVTPMDGPDTKNSQPRETQKQSGIAQGRNN